MHLTNTPRKLGIGVNHAQLAYECLKLWAGDPFGEDVRHLVRRRYILRNDISFINTLLDLMSSYSCMFGMFVLDWILGHCDGGPAI